MCPYVCVYNLLDIKNDLVIKGNIHQEDIVIK